MKTMQRRKPKVKRNLSHVLMFFIIWGFIWGCALPALTHEKEQLQQKQELHKELSQSGVFLVSMLDTYDVVVNEDEDGASYSYTMKYKYTYNDDTYYITDSKTTSSELKDNEIARTLSIYIDETNPDIVVYSDVSKYATGGIDFMRFFSIFVGIILTFSLC